MATNLFIYLFMYLFIYIRARYERKEFLVKPEILSALKNNMLDHTFVIFYSFISCGHG